MYSIPLVLLFHTTAATTLRWSIRLTTQAPAGIPRLPACGPRLEPPPAVAPLLPRPAAEEARRLLQAAVVQQRVAHARQHGALLRFTRVAIRRAKTEPTTRLIGGRRVTPPLPTVGRPA